jgi:transposase
MRCTSGSSSTRQTGRQVFPGHGKLKPEDEELRRLQRELQIVTTERDILKKTIGYFAKDEK